MISALMVCWVVSIGDGDSLTARCGGNRQLREVRIHAIDAPERHQPFHLSARNSLAALCLQTRASIQPLDTDRYGRTVGAVQCRGEDVAQRQVRLGMAWVYRRYAQTRSDLWPLQAQARAERLGLWADPQPQPPWLWRRR